MKKQKTEDESLLKHELHVYQEHGVGLYLNGKNFRSEKITQIVAESDSYMRDYIIEGGELKAIDFRKLSEEDRKR